MVRSGIKQQLNTWTKSGLLLFMLMAASSGIILKSINDFHSPLIELSEDVETECEGEVSVSPSEVDLYSEILVLRFNDLIAEIELHQCLAGLLFHPVHEEVLTPPPEVV